MPRLNAGELNSSLLNGPSGAGPLPYSLESEMRRMQDTHPITRIIYVDHDGNETDISAYYLSGAVFEQVKERAPDEISAGDFDINLANHDNRFSEFVVGSLFYEQTYHLAQIVVYQGFILPDGSEETAIMAVGYIDQLIASEDDSTVTLRCRDLMRKIVDQKLHTPIDAMEPTANISNTGDGVMTGVETKPFETVSEDWTLTCTTPGPDGTAIFSVVGSVSGNIGNATSGDEFESTGTGGLRFTISAGVVNWAAGDKFTFSTRRYPQWSGVNAGKIIWSILTGYNWDSDTQESWHASVLGLDHTKSDGNIHLDYESFAEVIDGLDDDGTMNLTGYIEAESDAIDVLQTLTLLFLGSLYTGRDGRLRIKRFVPGFGSAVAWRFSDARKMTKFGYTRTIDEVINYVSVHYKKNNVWPWSDDDQMLDGNFVVTNTDSIDKYDVLAQGFSVNWFAPNGSHVEDFATKLIQRYSEPPLSMDLDTGADALLAEIGDIVEITDTKYGIFGILGEVTTVSKDFDSQPLTIHLRVRRDAALTVDWGFLGSRVDEGDGLSPQAANWDDASATDKSFIYLGKTGEPEPLYTVF